MDNIQVTLPDGSVQSLPAGTSPLDVARAISPRLADDAIVARVDGNLWDLNRPFEGNAKLEAVHGVAQISGPAVAGVVIQWLTAPVAVAADVVSFALSATAVGLIRKREQRPEPGSDQHLGREIAEAD